MIAKVFSYLLPVTFDKNAVRFFFVIDTVENLFFPQVLAKSDLGNYTDYIRTKLK